MYLQDLNLNSIDYAVLKTDLINGITEEEVPSEEEVKLALASMYTLANTKISSLYYRDVVAVNDAKKQHFSFHLAGNTLWMNLKKFLAHELPHNASLSTIIDTIIDYLSSVISGGVIISFLVQKVVKYVASVDYTAGVPVAVVGYATV